MVLAQCALIFISRQNLSGPYRLLMFFRQICKELLEGALVIVGGTAFGMADIVPTPYSGAAFGVELRKNPCECFRLSVPFTPAGRLALRSHGAFSGFVYAASVKNGKAVEYGLVLLALFLPLACLEYIYLLQSFDIRLGWMVPALFGFLASS